MDETQVSPDQTNEAPAAPAVEEPKVHPAWDKMLEEIPTVLHGKIAPFLIENDKNVQSQLERYSPYKEYVDQNISADYLNGALSVARRIEQDPLEVYNNLQVFLREQGIIGEEAKQIAKDAMEAESGENFEDLFGDDVSPAVKKELDALKAKTAEIEEYKNQQEFQKLQAEAEADMARDMESLLQAHPGLTESHQTMIFNIMNAALNAGNDITVAEAAKELQAMIGAFPSSQTSEPAPVIVGSSGGAGIPAINVSIPKDAAGKKELLKQMFEERRRQNNL